MKVVGVTLLLVAMATTAMAQTRPAPEIDATSAVSALALLSGGLVMLRSRRKKK
jgi:hypothetical protein